MAEFNKETDKTYTFQESRYPDFDNFTNMLQNVTYVYICEFMRCEAQHRNYINIIYNSAIHKLNNYMNSNMNQQALIDKGY